MKLKPRQPAPPLRFDLADGSHWDLSAQKPKTFTMVVFYRGLHCPRCRDYLTELQQRLDDLEALGVSVVAVSADDRDRAFRSKAEWKLDRLCIGHGLSTEAARKWDLFISKALREGETPEFFEPGLFLVRPTGVVQYAAVTSSPWGRPPIMEVLGGIKFAIEQKSPGRGEA